MYFRFFYYHSSRTIEEMFQYLQRGSILRRLKQGKCHMLEGSLGYTSQVYIARTFLKTKAKTNLFLHKGKLILETTKVNNCEKQNQVSLQPVNNRPARS